MRRRATKKFVLIVIWIGLNSSAVLACTCIEGTPNEDLKEADVVFAGKVMDENQRDWWVSRIGFDLRPPFIHLTEALGQNRTIFEVATVWKGEIFAKASVLHGSPCGYYFR